MGIYLSFFSFFFFRLSFELSFAFFCDSFLPLSRFPLSPISVSPCLNRHFPDGVYLATSPTSASLSYLVRIVPDIGYNPRMNRTSESLVGSIEHVTYHNADNGFAVLKTAAKWLRDLVTVVGHLAFAIPGICPKCGNPVS